MAAVARHKTNLFPYVKSAPVLTQNGSERFLILSSFDMQEIGTLSKLHMVRDQDYIQHVWPLLAMWGLENLYFECRPETISFEEVKLTEFKI